MRHLTSKFPGELNGLSVQGELNSSKRPGEIESSELSGGELKFTGRIESSNYELNRINCVQGGIESSER